MPARQTALRNGFTLVELLVVLFIIGIVVSSAMLATGDFGQHRRLVSTATTLKNTINLLQHQAILENSPIGLRITNNQYQALRFTPPSNWSPLPGSHLFQLQSLPLGISITNLQTVKGRPAVVITNTGELEPFNLELHSGNRNKRLHLSRSNTNDVLIQQSDNP